MDKRHVDTLGEVFADVPAELLKKADKSVLIKKNKILSIGRATNRKKDLFMKFIKNPISVLSIAIIFIVLLLCIVYTIKNNKYVNRFYDETIFKNAFPVWSANSTVTAEMPNYNPITPSLTPIILQLDAFKIGYEVKEIENVWYVIYNPMKSIGDKNVGVLGFDVYGRDVFTLMFVSFGYLILTATAAAVIQFAFGFVAATYITLKGEGRIQKGANTLVKVMSKMPVIFWYIPLMFVFKDSIAIPFIVASLLFGWIGIARKLVVEFENFSSKNFIISERSKGSITMMIAFKHALPIMSRKLISVFLNTFPQIIITQITLAFIGFTSDSLYLSFGNLIFNAVNNIQQWWQLLIPTIFMSLVIIAFYGLSHTLRESGVKYEWK